jgi:hypothetical protein
MSLNPDSQPSFAIIPDPEAVRARLAIVSTEAALLEKLLKIAERKKRELERLERQRQEVGRAS